MSKSWQKTHCVSDYGRHSTPFAKRKASRAVRRYGDTIPDGRLYRRTSNPWDIFDYKYTRTPHEEAHDYHHPEQHWSYPDDHGRWARVTRRVTLLSPRSYWSPIHNAYRYKIRPEQKLPKGWGFDDVTGEYIEPRHSWDWETMTSSRTTRHCVFFKKEVSFHIDEWFYIPPDTERHEKEFRTRFEKDTRNYRSKKRWGRTWRRDRRSLSRREVGHGPCSKVREEEEEWD